MSDRIEFSVVICTHTEARWEDLVRAIDSVSSQTLPAAEIILVIDHNEALYRRARAKWHGLPIVRNRGNRGLSGARNAGVAVAQSALVAFLDDDAIAASDWLESLGGPYRDPNVLGVGGTAEGVWDGGRPAWFPMEFDWVVGCSYRGLSTGVSPIRNPIGCNMSFRRKVLTEVGGFREGIGRLGAIPLGCEETELSIRAAGIRPGGIILHLPEARVRHRVTLERACWRYFCKRCYAEGISKAQITRWVGTARSLASERRHVVRALPQGVAGALRDALTHRQPAHALRGVAIIAGLAITATGYLRGRLSGRHRWTRPQLKKAETTSKVIVREAT